MKFNWKAVALAVIAVGSSLLAQGTLPNPVDDYVTAGIAGLGVFVIPGRVGHRKGAPTPEGNQDTLF